MNNEQVIDTLKKLHASGMLGFPQITALDKAIAALSKEPAKPAERLAALIAECDGIDRADVLGMDWSHARDTVIRTAIVYTYLQQLTAAHAAELAEKDAEIERLKGLLTIYFNAQQEKTK